MHCDIPPAVNFHLWKPCNLRCKFCYAVFDDDLHLQAVRGGLAQDDALRLLELLKAAGVEKLTFVGGDPREAALARCFTSFDLADLIHFPNRQTESPPRRFDLRFRERRRRGQLNSQIVLRPAQIGGAA